MKTKKKLILTPLIVVAMFLCFGLGNASANLCSSCQSSTHYLLLEFQGCSGNYCNFEVKLGGRSGEPTGTVIQVLESIVPGAVKGKTCGPGQEVNVGNVTIDHIAGSFTYGSLWCWPP